MTKNENKCKDIFAKTKFLERKDLITMSILTFVFAVLVFFRIGNTYAPQSMYTATSDNRDIVLDFGDYVTVEQAHIYLGNLDNRSVTLSVFNEVTHAWEVINPNGEGDPTANISSVFQWNDVNIYYNFRYLGIVCTDDEAIFGEIVFTGPSKYDENGEVVKNILTPVNADRYPELFDEQDTFYSTYSHSYMDGTMFDEIYHGRTGYEFVHHLPTYETTHPQLGKCLIALGIKIFGMTPFGWRFFVALFGIFFVPLMYVFAKKMFNDTFVATCVGFFITFDCMHYTLSRIATIDIFVAFFIVMAYYFMYRYLEMDNIYRKESTVNSRRFLPGREALMLALSGISMGLAIATKLTGVYAACGLAVIFIYHTIRNWPKGQALRLFFFCLLFFIILPLVFYTLAYIPAVEANAMMGYTDTSISFGSDGISIGYGRTGLIARTIRNTNYMINYHRNLVADHPFESPYFTWPVVRKPLLAANDVVSYTVDGRPYHSSVSYLGNVVIWWSAIPCCFYILYRAVFKKDTKAQFLGVAYLAQYIPWMGVSRITFIYHYLPSILFNMIMMGYTIKLILEKKPQLKPLFKVFLILIILCFLLYFPVISGLPFPRELSLKLQLMDGWFLA